MSHCHLNWILLNESKVQIKWCSKNSLFAKEFLMLPLMSHSLLEEASPKWKLTKLQFSLASTNTKNQSTAWKKYCLWIIHIGKHLTVLSCVESTNNRWTDATRCRNGELVRYAISNGATCSAYCCCATNGSCGASNRICYHKGLKGRDFW